MQISDLKDLKRLIEETSFQVAQSKDYISIELDKLQEMLRDCEQYSNVSKRIETPILVDSVIMLKKYIPNYLLDINGIDRTVLNGIYVKAPVYLLPYDSVEKCKTRYGVNNPELYGLPSHEQADYNTIQEIFTVGYVVLAKFKGNYLNEVLTTPSSYKYFF